MVKKIILSAIYSVIEPLGLLHLVSVAKQEGWDAKIVLIKDNKFDILDKVIHEYKPSMVGFSIYTGNHSQIINYIDYIQNYVEVIVGGPHATYFPDECIKHADYVVISEGFNGFREILKGIQPKGIVHLKEQESFPLSDRELFYSDYPKLGSSPIKSIITQTGCPYRCSYCYNSSSLDSISSSLTINQKNEMIEVIKPLMRLFPKSIRSVDSIIDEVESIKNISPLTQMIYFQDDIFGSSIDWIKEFSVKYPRLGIPFHAQMRFEYVDPENKKARERIELIRESGCTGLTLAIESSNDVIRRELLDRNMKNELIFNVMRYLSELGYKVRTEQMIGLPCGSTTQPTPINIESDLETLELNVKLREETGLPNMTWTSIFMPYKGTKIYDYCVNHGFYSDRNEEILPSFFERSVLKFPKRWIGPTLNPDNKDLWLSEDELSDYKRRLTILSNLFNYFGLISHGHILARKFLDSKDLTFKNLGIMTRHHLYDTTLYQIKNSV